MEIIVILNNIRSNENVGSIFRTCDAVGVSKIILAGYTPAPTDRFGRENKGLTKASLGAEKSVSWGKFEKLADVIKNLKSRSSGSQLLRKSHLQNGFSDFKIVAVEQDKKAINYRKIKNIKTDNIALVFGNEVEGLSKEDIKLCDIVAELPMRGKKESLNVSVCAGIVLYSLLNN
jgi:23S rRNA (guanosine2251-2'-O)-methyltransferase